MRSMPHCFIVAFATVKMDMKRMRSMLHCVIVALQHLWVQIQPTLRCLSVDHLVILVWPLQMFIKSSNHESLVRKCLSTYGNCWFNVTPFAPLPKVWKCMLICQLYFFRKWLKNWYGSGCTSHTASDGHGMCVHISCYHVCL